MISLKFKLALLLLNVFSVLQTNAVRLTPLARLFEPAENFVDVSQDPYPKDGDNTCKPLGTGGSGTYHYVSHDGKPVIYSAKVTLNPKNCGQGTKTDTYTRDYVHALGKSTDDAGHICAHQLGGDGVNPINVFPQDPTINRGIYREFEAEIIACLCPSEEEADKSSHASEAHLSWAFKYASSKDTRPTGVTYKASFTGGSCKDLSQTFAN